VATPRRKVGRGPRLRSFLVLVEGDATEEDYLLYWRRKLRLQVQIDIPDFHGTPLSLVECAVEIKKREEREERKRRGRMHNEYWCVFDVDTHPNLQAAIDLAAANEIELAISNPCIELWFLLHFAEQTAYLDSSEAVRAVRPEVGSGKGVSTEVSERMSDLFGRAKERAQKLEEKHRGDGTPAPGNPSSAVWRLIDALHRRPPDA
jgi:hypothetical protein